MKKITSILCLLALTVGLLAGCGSTSGTAATAETTAVPAAETTVETTAETTAASTEPAVPVRLGAMTGPTGIGMVKLFRTADENPDSGYTYTIKGAADELTPMILQGELDIVSVPANLASVLYNKTEGGVQALAVNVLGVLYVAEFNGETVQSVTDLKGKTLYATGKGSTPEYFLRYVLTQNGLDPDKDLTIEWKSEPSEVVATLNDQGTGIAMLPQPYVTAAAASWARASGWPCPSPMSGRRWEIAACAPPPASWSARALPRRTPRPLKSSWRTSPKAPPGSMKMWTMPPLPADSTRSSRSLSQRRPSPSATSCASPAPK